MNSGTHQLVFTDPTSKLHSAGDMVAIIEVLVRPPSESCNILVNLLSLLVQEGSNHQKITRSAYKGRLFCPIQWNGLVFSKWGRNKNYPPPPQRKEKWIWESKEKTYLWHYFQISISMLNGYCNTVYAHIFARSISLWTGSLDKYEVAKRTAVIFFCVCRATEARAWQAFLHFFPCKWLALCTYSHSPESHKRKIMLVLQA